MKIDTNLFLHLMRVSTVKNIDIVRIEKGMINQCKTVTIAVTLTTTAEIL